MQFAQYALPDFCRFSSGISPEIRFANVCVSIFSKKYLIFLISGVKKAYQFRHFRQSPPLSGFFPVFRPPSRLFPQGSGGMLRQRQPPLLMRPLHCAFQPGDSHASDIGHSARKDCRPRTGPLPLPVWHVAFHAKSFPSPVHDLQGAETGRIFLGKHFAVNLICETSFQKSLFVRFPISIRSFKISCSSCAEERSQSESFSHMARDTA